MNQEMLERLSVITEEEREILNGRTEIDRTRYTQRETNSLHPAKWK